MVYSGEIAGKIDETLEAIAKQMQKNLELETQVRSALMYPATVLGAIVLAGIVIMIFVVPRFMSLFEEFDAELPWATQIMITISEFMQIYWWLVLTVVAGGWMMFQNWRKSESGKHTWDGFLLQVPLFRGIVNNIQTIRVANNFGTLMHSGVPVTKALHILSQIMPNAVIRDAVFSVEQNVKKGHPINECFKAEPVFDPVIGEVVEVGEQSGSIPEVLEKTGMQYELEVESQLKNLTSLIEPVIIIVVGSAVVFMAMAIMSPIFKMQEMFSAA
jgi:type II secretory pathway component PulF